MQHKLPRRLELMKRARYCLADWEMKWGEHFAAIKPLLVKSVGELSGSYPTDCPAIRYTIDPRGNRFAGFVVGEHELLEYEDRQALRTTDVVYDLFKDQSDIFKELFEIRSLSGGLFRLKVTFEAQ